MEAHMTEKNLSKKILNYNRAMGTINYQVFKLNLV